MVLKNTFRTILKTLQGIDQQSGKALKGYTSMKNCRVMYDDSYCAVTFNEITVLPFEWLLSKIMLPELPWKTVIGQMVEKNCYCVIHTTYLLLKNASIKYYDVKDLSSFLW